MLARGDEGCYNACKEWESKQCKILVRCSSEHIREHFVCETMCGVPDDA